MYLSKLILNPRSRQANIDKGNPYELHRSIMLAFPAYDHETERVLFRLDGERLGSLLVQSTIKPDWSILKPSYLLEIPQVKTFGELLFTPGQVFRFRLRANPSKRHPKSHKRIGLYKEGERIKWLQRKGEQHGFSIVKNQIDMRATAWREFNLASKQDHKKHRGTFNFVDFDGLLIVESPELLNAAIQQGIGPAKGFGCGLLSLARV
ncbi:MAG: type I-E CRISPR-associated protein Cas6/Cse3/CasE [Chloroflexota bacterium]|nr:type I-E CRISPR-associated protein Cas6/Cse3/CasE [Chloroflexota bacterium]